MPVWRSVNSVNVCVGEGRIVGGSELIGGHNCHFLFLSAFAFLGCSLTQCVRDVFINENMKMI